MMATCALLGVVIALEARPVLQFVRANQAGVPLEIDLGDGAHVRGLGGTVPGQHAGRRSGSGSSESVT